ncbi:MAG: hypothetical protein A2176_04045 [Spirochaetes bacterium RBG_13_51_14]|nr:MAG: hypothetical protein A2176_04045 [Spirochaetes bacterium RBG_13_51_14]
MLQRYRIIVLLFLAGMVAGNATLNSGGIVSDRRSSDKEAMERQRAADRERIDKIKKELREFMDDINKRLGADNRTRIVDPIDVDNIEDIGRIDHSHSRKKIPAREYAYAGGDQVPLRSEGNRESAVVGRLKFRERVEVLAQTERLDSIKETEAPWILVRRDNGDEGWIFGAFLQKTEPEKKRDPYSSGRERGRGYFSAPVAGTVTSKFGYRVNPVTKRSESFHRGLDIAAPEGTPVKASADGTVISAEFRRSGYGNMVIIEHEKELSTYYGHLADIRVRKGQKISCGDIVGTVGKTGRATGPHLHFEVRRGGTACDPEAFLR